MGNGMSQQWCPIHWVCQSFSRQECADKCSSNSCSSLPIAQFFQIGFPMMLAAVLARELREKDETKTRYKRKVSKLQRELDELRRCDVAAGTTNDESQSQPGNGTSISPPQPSGLRLLVEQLEKQEDHNMKEQQKMAKDVSRRLERIEDIACSYFKPRAARCRLEEDLLDRVDKGYLRGIVTRKHLSQILECDPKFCGLTSEENGRLRQIYAKYWQTKLKLNKYRAIVCQIKHSADDSSPPPAQ